MVPASCHSSRASLGRTQSAGSEVGGSSSDSQNERSDGIYVKRSGRFCLRRQECLEKGEGPTDSIAPIPTIVRSSPNSPLMTPHYREGTSAASPPPISALTQITAPVDHLQVQITTNNTVKTEYRENPESPPQAPHAHTTPVLTKQRSNPLSGAEGGQSTATSLPPLLPKPPPYSPSHHPQSPASHVGPAGIPSGAHRSGSPSKTGHMSGRPMTPPAAHKLPSVRVIPDVESGNIEYQRYHTHRNSSTGHTIDEEPLGLDPVSRTSPLSSSSIPDSNLLHPGSNRTNYGPTPTDMHTQEPRPVPSLICKEVNLVTNTEPFLSTVTTGSRPSNVPSPPIIIRSSVITEGTHVCASTSSPSSIGTTSRPSSATLPASSVQDTPTRGTSSIPVLSSHIPEQFGHCPKARDGPALGCNYCWNTTDVNGRILRRKTKYHCPDCQANLCIVPCFQAYHEQLDREKAATSIQPH